MRRSTTTQHIHLAGLLCCVGLLVFYSAPAVAQENPSKANEVTLTPVNAGIVGVASGSATWGDFDSDGDSDLLVTGAGSDGPSANIYENRGDGTFQSIDAGLTGVGGDSDWGDYDGDGDLDVVVTGVDPEGNPTATIYRNDGGEFSEIGAGLTGVKSSSVAWGDYDRDGDLDLAIIGLDDGDNQTAKIYRNEGDGSFQEIGADLPGVGIGSVDWGDFDGDDDLDLAIAGRTSSFGQVTRIYRNDGGSFETVNAGLTDLQGGSVNWGDFDGDGDLDLVTAGYGSSGYSTIIYENQGSGTFQPIDAGLFGVAKNSSTDWGDFNGDGRPDLAISGSDGTDRRTIVYRNEGDGNFQSIDANLTGVRGSSVDWGDYDGDGDPDLVVSGRNSDGNPTTRLYENEGSDSPPDLEDGLIAYYPFNGNANDESGNGNDGTVNGATLTTDRSGSSEKAYDFDGNNDYIDLPDDAVNTSAGSVCAWFLARSKTEGENDRVFSMSNFTSPGGTRLYLSLASNQEFRAAFIDDQLGDVPIAYGEWQHTCFTWNSDSSELYVNGTSEGTSSGGEPTNGRVNLGSYGEGLKSFLDGKIDQIRVYDRPLTEDEVQQLYGGGNGGLEAPTDLQATAGDSQVDLIWNPGGESTPAGYNVYRSTSSFSDIAEATKLNGSLLSDASYKDREVTNGTEYFYRVTAVDGDGNESSPSAEVRETPREEQTPGSVSFTEANASLDGVGGSSSSITDVDGDGNEDLLVIGENENSLPVATLYLGDGQGGFTEAGADLTGVSFGSTSIADINEDGSEDLLITGRRGSEQTTTLYLGDGQGGFTEANADLAGVSFSSTSIADVNGDGNKDLLITGASEGTKTTTLYLGDGQGGFTEAGANLDGVSIGSTSISDINGDGAEDLLITGNAGVPDSPNPTATLYFGDGQGGFTKAGADLTGVYYGSTSIADVNGDGNKDLLITGDSDGGRIATVYLGDGQGGFTKAGAGLTGVNAGAASSISNVGGNESKDILIAGNSNSGPTTKLYLGDGQSGFNEAGASLTGVVFGSTSISDVNGDGLKDLFVAGEDTDGNKTATLYLNQSSVTVQPPTDLQATAGDGQVDLTWNSGVSSSPAGYNVYRSTESFSDPSNATKLNSSLLSSENYLDTEVTNRTKYFYRVTAVDGEGSESGLSGEASATPTGGVTSSFSKQKIITANAAKPSSVYAKNLDDDEDADVLSASATGSQIAWHENLGGEFSEQKTITSNLDGNASSVHAEDLDGDGDADVLSASGGPFSGGKIAWYENLGDGGFSDQKVITTTANAATSVYAQDLDGDSDPDVLSASESQIAWHENLDSGGFSEQKVITTSVEEAQSVYAQDLDGDSDPDVLSASNNSTTLGGKIAWYENLGDGGFSDQKVITTTANAATSVYAQDLDGDSDPDVLSASFLDDKIAWYENLDDGGDGGPKAPTDLQATAGDSQVDLTWNPGGESTPAGYNVYRSTSSFSDLSNAKKLNGSLLSDERYKDTELTNGTEYFYRVTAVDGEGTESQPSSGVAATPPGIQEENVLSAYSEIAKSVADTRFGRSLKAEYENQNIKHLASIGIGWEFFQGTMLIDLDDYFGITPEGRDKDWVTVWVNGSASVGVSLLPFDLGMIRAKYEPGTPDPDRGFDFSSASIRLGSVKIESFKKTGSGGVRASEWSFNDSFKVNASASFANFAWNLHQFEVKRSALDRAVKRSREKASSVIRGLPGGPLINFFFEFREGPLKYPIPRFSPVVELSELRPFTSTDTGNPPEIGGTINYGRGGIDTDDDGLRNNRYPVVENAVSRFLTGWEFNLKFSIDGNEVSDYTVAPIEVPDGWKIGSKDGEGFAAIFDETWEEEDLTRGDEITTQWVVSCTNPDQSPVTVGFELYEDGTFSDNPVDTLYVEFKKRGSVSVISGRVTGTNKDKSISYSKRAEDYPQKTQPSLVDSTRDTPFKLSLETPSGEAITPTSVDLTQSYYFEADTDSSGTTDAQYVIANPEDGNYSVKVEPHSDTPEETRVTIETITSGTFQTVARDQPVPDEGSETYPVDTDPLSDRPARTAFDVQRSFGDASDPSDYRLVALPGAIDRSLGNIVDGEAGTDWTAFWDSGASEDFLVEYDGSETFTVRPGRGFWLTNRESWTTQDSVDTVQLGNDRSASVPLHDGWNIISNPLSVDVAWSDVQQVNSGSLQPVWSFDGSFAQADTFRSAKTGEAFYFLNDAGRDSLFIPYSRTSESKSWRTSNEKTYLSLTARPRKKASPTSTVRIGFDRAAKKGLGPLDQPAPPGQFSALSLWLEAPGNASQRYRRLGTEQRPPNFGTDEGETFDLLLRSKVEGPVQITTEHLEAVEGAEAKLLHPSTGRSYNLIDGEPVVVREADSTTLRLAIGSETFVQGQAEKVVPDEVTLTSYPNPMRKQATLEYTLPEAKEVRLTVYDVLGRRVSTMEQGRKQAGRHRIRLQGDQLSSGVYFGHLQVGDQTRTQKITVVR